MSSNLNDGPRHDDARAFAIVMAGTALLGVFAFGLSLLFGVPLGEQFSFSARDALIGAAATLPLVVFLWRFSNSRLPFIVKFRDSQIAFFANIGFAFTPLRIALMAFGAGVSEELLFRGFLQTWLAGFSPVVVALILSNIVFGLLHMRTVLYAVIAGAVGVYLGALYLVTDNLLAPIMTHMLYDAVALEYTRRAIAKYRAGGQQAS